MVSCELWRSATRVGVRQEKGRSGGEIKWKLSEVNTRAVFIGQNKLIGEFKMAAVIWLVLGDRLWSKCTFQQEFKGSW